LEIRSSKYDECDDVVSSSAFALSTPVDHSSFANPSSPLSIEGDSNTPIMSTLPVQNTITSTISVGPRLTHTRQYSSIVTAAGTRLSEKGKGNDKEAQGVTLDRAQSQRQIKRILFFPNRICHLLSPISRLRMLKTTSSHKPSRTSILLRLTSMARPYSRKRRTSWR